MVEAPADRLVGHGGLFGTIQEDSYQELAFARSRLGRSLIVGPCRDDTMQSECHVQHLQDMAREGSATLNRTHRLEAQAGGNFEKNDVRNL